VASYVVVVGVAAVTAFTAGEAIAPMFLERHLEQMARIDPHWAENPAMAADLGRQYRAAFTRSLTWALVAAAVATVVIGVFATLRIVTPLRAMEVASREIASGRYDERLDGAAVGEIGAVARSFNVMATALDESEERRRQLVGDLAHEIRTPLSNLRGYLEGLEDGVFEADAETTGAFTRQLDRLERLVEDLSLLSRLDAGEVAVRPARHAVNDLVVTSTTAFRARFEERGVSLVVGAAPRDATVRADAARFAQVLENLLGNAARYAPPGGTVEVAVRVSSERVRFEVRDDGPGVAAELREAVFRRFVRGDASRSDRNGVGSGIGLTIAKELVERQGGAIGLEPRPGGGSVFWFTLPRA
jgi:signal transduction histidine kinase